MEINLLAKDFKLELPKENSLTTKETSKKFGDNLDLAKNKVMGKEESLEVDKKLEGSKKNINEKSDENTDSDLVDETDDGLNYDSIYSFLQVRSLEDLSDEPEILPTDIKVLASEAEVFVDTEEPKVDLFTEDDKEPVKVDFKIEDEVDLKLFDKELGEEVIKDEVKTEPENIGPKFEPVELLEKEEPFYDQEDQEEIKEPSLIEVTRPKRESVEEDLETEDSPNDIDYEKTSGLTRNFTVEDKVSIKEAENFNIGRKDFDEQILDQIVEKADFNLENGKSQVVMKLKPESLGELVMDIEVKDNQIVAKVFVDNNKVKNAIEQNIIILKENLEKTGLEIKTIDVNIGNFDSYKEEKERSREYEEFQKGLKKNRGKSLKAINFIEAEETDVLSRYESGLQESGINFLA